jgi:hypothetical protein
MTLAISREVTGGVLHVVATLTFPSLHLDLAIAPAGLVRRLLERDARRGRCHDETQWQHVETELVPALLAFDVVHANDTTVRLAKRNPGMRGSSFSPILAAATRVALAVEALPANIPPPACFADAVESWRALARRLGGTLETARMAVSGTLDGTAVSVVTEWDPRGPPHATCFAVASPRPIDRRYVLDLADPELASTAVETSTTRWPEAARSLLSKLLAADVWGIRIEEGTIELRHRAPLLDTSGAPDVLRDLLRLAALLAGDTGPFR